MSAKKSRKATATPATASPVPTPTPALVTATAAPATEAPVAWIDSPDPRKRQIGKIALVVVWVYVAALWLLALDQWFKWGIFGP